ncbi:thioesterase family protein [Burkholderia multivorans]|uniref:thioesterase family protein n=1 Tax=Burkholderia multivorans TaxID=87883 RepID=UPI0021BE0E7C|nr:thioesterase family protein [Burkholderia multivorans]
MNLLLRLFFTLLLSRRRSRVGLLDACATTFRVLPSDLDVLGHMTNARYFSILDLARVDFMIRSGMWPRLKARSWYPVVTSETIRFHRSLKLWERYQVLTQIIGWDEKHVFIEQRFVRDGVMVASGVIRARILKRGGGTLGTSALLEVAKVTQQSPPLPEWVVRWSEAEGGMEMARSVRKQSTYL